MAEIEYFTQAGLQKLKDELDRLILVERPKVVQAIAEARDKGDLSENAEYDAAESKMDTSKALLLSTVKIKNLKTNAVMAYTLVPEKEADLKNHKISVTSPIAKGLLGKSVGDQVEIQVPAGKVMFEIIEITR